MIQFALSKIHENKNYTQAGKNTIAVSKQSRMDFVQKQIEPFLRKSNQNVSGHRRNANMHQPTRNSTLPQIGLHVTTS